jgi:hypothetical protein
MMSKSELAEKLHVEGFRENGYTLDGTTPPYEGYMLVGTEHGVWYILYFERGSTNELARYSSEEEACERFYWMLLADSTMKPSA